MPSVLAQPERQSQYFTGPSGASRTPCEGLRQPSGLVRTYVAAAYQARDLVQWQGYKAAALTTLAQPLNTRKQSFGAGRSGTFLSVSRNKDAQSFVSSATQPTTAGPSLMDPSTTDLSGMGQSELMGSASLQGGQVSQSQPEAVSRRASSVPDLAPKDHPAGSALAVLRRRVRVDQGSVWGLYPEAEDNPADQRRKLRAAARKDRLLREFGDVYCGGLLPAPPAKPRRRAEGEAADPGHRAAVDGGTGGAADHVEPQVACPGESCS